MQMAPEMQIKQFVAVVKNPKTNVRFQVFQTGDSKYYLFDPLDKYGCSTCMQFPVKKMDLKPELRKALAHGYGNAGL